MRPPRGFPAFSAGKFGVRDWALGVRAVGVAQRGPLTRERERDGSKGFADPGLRPGYDIPALRALSGWTLLPSRSRLAGSLREA